MDYPFRMYGEIVEVYRYQIKHIGQSGLDEESTEYAHTEEEAQSIASQTGGTVAELDSANYEWMDGLHFATRNEAIEAYDLGESWYKNKTQQEQSTGLSAQLTDLQMALVELYEKML